MRTAIHLVVAHFSTHLRDRVATLKISTAAGVVVEGCTRYGIVHECVLLACTVVAIRIYLVAGSTSSSMVWCQQVSSYRHQLLRLQPLLLVLLLLQHQQY
jgi:hypothetical protein